MPQTQLFFPTQTPTPSSTPRRTPWLDCSSPIMCGRATGCNLASTLALNLKTKHQMIPKCESMPRRKPTSGAQLSAQVAPTGYQCHPLIPATILLGPHTRSHRSYEKDLILSQFTDE